MIGLDLFIAAFAIGVGGTGWLIQGEYFPTALRGRAAAIGASADWQANFALILLVPTMLNGIGLASLMVLFAAVRGRDSAPSGGTTARTLTTTPPPARLPSCTGAAAGFG
jgi:Sugar (and other) transporter